MKLTAKQAAFCREYLVDLNATQAAIRAGYSKKTAGAIGNENLQKPEIARVIAELADQRAERTQVDADWVLAEAVNLYKMAVEDGNLAVAARTLEIAGRHINVGAFQDKLAVESTVEGSLTVNTNQIADHVYREIVKAERDRRKSPGIH